MQKEKERMLLGRLRELTTEHKKKCGMYAQILDTIGKGDLEFSDCTEIPFIPVRLFKKLDLSSVPDDQVLKRMTSSGTSGQAVSRILLDRTTALNQQKAMVRIVSDFTGQTRMPMVIIDSPSVIRDRREFSARGAGILGFSVFGSDRIYALDEDMKLDLDGISRFLEEHHGQRILLFGFTFMIWQHFYLELKKKRVLGEMLDLSNGVMIHGGGWKKLISEAVTPKEFSKRLKDVCGIEEVYDYYGMVEQTGSIYMQCECGCLHASVFSDIIIRKPFDFSVCKTGEKGIIQTISAIPESYPGHSLLTEDEGVIEGVDDCPCGRKGKYFRVIGRMKQAELRGCSDTYAENLR